MSRPSDRPGVRANALAFALLVGFAVLTLVALRAPENAVDSWVTDQVQQLTALDGFWRAISWFGYGPIDLVLPVLAIAALLGRRWWLEGTCLTASVIVSAVANEVAKHVIARARPALPVRIEELVVGTSFPSGHVMQYVALFGFLAIVVAARVRSGAVRAITVSALGAVTLLIGPSRIYLGAHWISDVLGGYLLGGAWLVIVRRYYLSRSAR